MDYRIEYSPEADRNGDEAYEWIARNSPFHAAKWYSGLLKAISSLSRNAEHCGLAPESYILDRSIRQLLYGKRQHKYRVLFLRYATTRYTYSIFDTARGTGGDRARVKFRA